MNILSATYQNDFCANKILKNSEKIGNIDQNMTEMNDVILEPSTFSISVSYIATGINHYDKTMGQISVSIGNNIVLLNMYIKPKKYVKSFLTCITGLHYELLNKYGVETEDAIRVIKEILPYDAVLVGYGIEQFAKSLNLQQGINYKELIDIRDLWSIWDSYLCKITKFSFAHQIYHLLGINKGGICDTAFDAILSYRLYTLYLKCQKSKESMKIVTDSLLKLPLIRSFSDEFPVIDGICMGTSIDATNGKCFCEINHV